MFTNSRYHHSVTRLQSVIPRHASGSAVTHDYMKPQEDRAVFLERTRRLCEQLHVDADAFQIVHVAGTSGKGSTSTMIYNMLRASGKKVGIFRSPFVTTSIENIEVDGLLIAPDAFADLVDRIIPIAEQIATTTPKQTPSYSELFFAIAMQYFTDSACEWVVLETGCGGRFDYTNIVKKPRVCVLTPINRDHTDILGNTLAEIAWHKAGIIKEGVPVISTETKAEVREVFAAEALAKQTRMIYVAPKRQFTTIMPGAHQQWNAAAAAGVGELLGLPPQAIADGIAITRLPARVEMMQRSPLVILDGAHSQVKMEALVESLNTFRPFGKLHLVFAAKETKTVTEVLRPIAPLADTLWMTSFQLPGFGSHSTAETAAVAATLAPHATIHVEPDCLAAVDRCIAAAKPQDCIVITGSLYLAGFVRTRWISEDAILQKRTLWLDTEGQNPL